MKKFAVVTILSLVLCLVGQAQVRPFVEEGKMWEVSYVYPGWETDPITVSVISGDSLLNGIAYKKVYKMSEVGPTDLSFAHLIREENGKVYFYSQSKGREYLWFDFSCEVGDEIPYDVEMYYYDEDFELFFPDDSVTCTGKVVAVRDTFITEDKLPRKVWDVKIYERTFSKATGLLVFEKDFREVVMIEEIGLIDRGLKGYDFSWTMVGGYYGSEILCVHDGQGNLILDAGKGCYWEGNKPDGIDCSPKAAASGAPLYDLSGRRLRAVPQKGVYIQGGKKRMK